MKTIPNVQFTFKLADNPADSAKLATTRSLLQIVIRQPPQQGFDFATMRARNRIADVLDKVKTGKEIVLEDSDYVTARKCVEDFRWSNSHPDLLKFAELFGL